MRDQIDPVYRRPFFVKKIKLAKPKPCGAANSGEKQLEDPFFTLPSFCVRSKCARTGR